MLCICSLFHKCRKLSRIFLENFKNSILTVFVPLTTIENICFYSTLINFILFRQMSYQLIWVANKIYTKVNAYYISLKFILNNSINNFWKYLNLRYEFLFYHRAWNVLKWHLSFLSFTMKRFCCSIQGWPTKLINHTHIKIT